MIGGLAGTISLGLQRAQLAVLPPARPQLLDAGVDPRTAQAEAWVREYLGKPHPELGRKGPVCPFAVPALNQHELWFALDERTHGRSLWDVRARMMGAAAAFETRARQHERPDMTALVMIFLALPAERADLLDRAHSQLKTRLMARDVMVASMHPASLAPAVNNPEFFALRAPFVSFVFRIMAVRDIVFVSHNRLAFARYRERFGELFAQGRVRDDFGHVTAYEEAVKRFS